MKYAIVIGKTVSGTYSAHVPDLPGCIGAADTVGELRTLMAEGIRFHIQGMLEDGETIPEPTDMKMEFVEVPDYVSQ